MLYRHVVDKTSTEFCGIFRVFVKFVGFRGFTWILRLHDRLIYQKPYFKGEHCELKICSYYTEKRNEIPNPGLTTNHGLWKCSKDRNLICLSQYGERWC